MQELQPDFLAHGKITGLSPEARKLSPGTCGKSYNLQTLSVEIQIITGLSLIVQIIYLLNIGIVHYQPWFLKVIMGILYTRIECSLQLQPMVKTKVLRICQSHAVNIHPPGQITQVSCCWLYTSLKPIVYCIIYTRGIPIPERMHKTLSSSQLVVL